MSKIQSENVQKTSAKFQYLATIVVNVICVCHGTNTGWSSPNVILLTSDESPLPSGKISMTEASWVASILCIGGLIGSIFFGFVTNTFGRKLPLIFLTIPTIIGWLLILNAQNVYYLYAARTINGIVAGGVFIIIPLYLNEISNDSIRGVLGSTVMLSCNTGILSAYGVYSLNQAFTLNQGKKLRRDYEFIVN